MELTDVREKYIDTFDFTVGRYRVGNGYNQRLFIKGLDEYALHYDISTTQDIILALIDFRRHHSPDELDYSFPCNNFDMDKIINFKFCSYPTEMVTEEGLIELFELVSDKAAYDFLVNETGFDYRRDFYAQVSGYYADTYEQLSVLREYDDKAEMRPNSRWLSIYDNRTSLKSHSSKNNEIKSDRISENPNYNSWRSYVLNRDKICQCCGHNGKLEVHHLFGYKENPSLATNKHNGVTLCKFCHKKYHSIYGVKDINPVDFMEFIRKYGVR